MCQSRTVKYIDPPQIEPSRARFGARISRGFVASLAALTAFLSPSAHADSYLNASPQSFTYQGMLTNSAGNAPLTDVVTFTIEIYAVNGSGQDCMLYEETNPPTGTVDLSTTGGLFAIQVGAGAPTYGANSLATAFSNAPVPISVGNSGTCTAGYTPNLGDLRYLRFTINDQTVPANSATLSPDQTLGSIPQALVAQTLQGIDPSGFVQVNTAGANQLTQVNAQHLFDGSDISSLGLHNFDSRYAKAGDSTAQSLGTGGVSIGTNTAPTGGTLLDVVGSSGTFAVSSSGNVTLTSATLGLGSFASAPTGTSAGQVWYNSTSGLIQYEGSSGVVTLGGGLTGSGTTGYVPYYSSSTGLADSPVYTNGTDVAIGTASPSSTFQIGASTADGHLEANDTGVADTSFLGIYTAGTGKIYGIRGSLGASLTSPSGYPVVALGGWYDGLGVYTDSNYSSDANPAFGVNASDQISGAHGVSGNLFNVQTNGVVTTYNNTLDSGNGGANFAGKIGIGTTTPASTLNVTPAPVASTVSGSVSIGEGAWNGSTAGFFNGNANGTELAVNSSSAYTGDLANLEVGGVSKFKVDYQGNVTAAGTLNETGTSDLTGPVNINTSGSGNTVVGFGGTGGVTIGNSTGGVTLDGAVSQASSSITQTGNSSVTLGTGTGTTNLGTGSGTTNVGTGSGTVNVGASTGSATAVNIGTGTSTGLVTIGNATGGTRIYPDVSVGSAPVSGTVLNVASVAQSGSTAYGLAVNAPTGASTNYAATFSGGNVGIGTTAPANKLHVSGGSLQVDGSNSQALVIEPSSAGSVNGVDMVTGTGGDLRMGALSTSGASGGAVFQLFSNSNSSFPGQLYFDAGDDANSSINFRTGSGGTAYNRMTILENGYVGIGTTNPGSLLQMSAPANSNAVATASTSGGSYAVFQVQTDAGDWQYGTGGSTSAWPGQFYVYNGNACTVPLVFDQSNNVGLGGNISASGSTFTGEKFYISSSTGRVGIGTGVPASTLNVTPAPVASSVAGSVSIGEGAWDGSTAGYFNGSGNGTELAINSASTYTGDLANLEVGGVSKFKVDKLGNVTMAGTLTASAVPSNVRVRSIGYVFDGAGAALPSGTTKYYTVPFSCTISAWNMTLDTGTATVDVWKVATGTAIPTVANTITAGAYPAISSGTALHSTTLTGWTTAVSANDIFAFNLRAVSSATTVSIVLECDE